MFNTITLNRVSPYLVISPLIATFLFLFPLEAGLDIVIGCCFLAFVTTIVAYRNKIKWNGYKTILICYILFAIFADLWNPNGYSSSRLRTLCYLSLFILTVPSVTVSFSLLKRLVVISNILLFFQGTYERFLLNIPRIEGHTASPNLYAIACAVLPLMLFAFIMMEKKKKNQIFMMLLFAASLTPLVYTQSRGGWLAFCCGFLILIIIGWRLIKINWSKSFLFSLTIALFLSFLAAKPIVYPRVQHSLHSITQLQEGNRYTAIGIRLDLWKSAIHTIKMDGPWWPKKSLEDNLEELYRDGLLSERIYKKNFHHYHNYYLTNFVSYGVFGFGIWLLFVLYPLATVLRNNKKNIPLLLITSIPPTVYLSASIVDSAFGDIRIFSFFVVINYLPFLLKNNCNSPGMTKCHQ